jgi:hypothetical protein
MLDGFAGLHPDDVDDGVAILAEEPRMVAVENDVITVGKAPFDLATRVRIFFHDLL